MNGLFKVKPKHLRWISFLRYSDVDLLVFPIIPLLNNPSASHQIFFYLMWKCPSPVDAIFLHFCSFSYCWIMNSDLNWCSSGIVLVDRPLLGRFTTVPSFLHLWIITLTVVHQAGFTQGLRNGFVTLSRLMMLFLSCSWVILDPLDDLLRDFLIQ